MSREGGNHSAVNVSARLVVGSGGHFEIQNGYDHTQIGCAVQRLGCLRVKVQAARQNLPWGCEETLNPLYA